MLAAGPSNGPKYLPSPRRNGYAGALLGGRRRRSRGRRRRTTAGAELGRYVGHLPRPDPLPQLLDRSPGVPVPHLPVHLVGTAAGEATAPVERLGHDGFDAAHLCHLVWVERAVCALGVSYRVQVHRCTGRVVGQGLTLPDRPVLVAPAPEGLAQLLDLLVPPGCDVQQAPSNRTGTQAPEGLDTAACPWDDRVRDQRRITIGRNGGVAAHRHRTHFETAFQRVVYR
jgi:hypothetical protein